MHCGESIACFQRCDVSENSMVGTSEVLSYPNVIELTLLETSTDTKHQAPWALYLAGRRDHLQVVHSLEFQLTHLVYPLGELTETTKNYKH